jgi:Domain of unknown function (DUF4082)
MIPRKPLLQLSVFALIVGLLWSTPSRAYRMSYVTSSNVATSLACNNRNGFAHWPWNQPTTYWYHNPSGAGAGKTTAIQQAMSTWTNASESDHVLVYAGTTSAGYNLNDSQNTLAWGDTTSSSLCGTVACHAITTVRFSSSTQILHEVDIVFNDQMDWRTDGTYDPTCSSATSPDGTPKLNVAIDTQAIVTHELGHGLGLGHPDQSEPSFWDATMGGASCKVDGRTLHSDDRAGLQCLTNRYPFNPAYEGFFDGYAGFNCTQISGWAYNANRANDPIYVNILDGSTLRGVILADQYRADLAAAGKGNGYHGFIYPVPSSMKNGQWHTISTRFSGGTESNLTWSPRNLICAVSIFTTQTPAEFLSHAGQAYSVGNVFSSSENGVITHLRYYKAAEESGTHTLKLWTSSGQLLASGMVNFTAGFAGWVTVDIPDVAIAKNTQYVVSVTTYTRQSKTSCGFSTPISNGPLTATGGLWAQGDGIFPTTSSCSNFWTDVRFNM